MPVYEYRCPKCKSKFELLRPSSRADEKASSECCHADSHRVLSMFSSMSKNSSGETAPIAGGGGCSCGGCTSTSGCATCH